MKSNNGLNGQGFPHPENCSVDISVINFEGLKVRIVKLNGEPWFVAKDVCAALELSNSRMALQALDDDERNTVTLTYGIRGNPNHSAVSESGFYKLIARSRKATTAGTFAHRFSNWVFREVIPSIRKTGSYGVPFVFLNDFSRRMAAYQQEASKRGYKLQQCKGAKEALEREEIQLWRKYQPELLGEDVHEPFTEIRPATDGNNNRVHE
ncbi:MULTISPECIES: BRO-N domain-containing protein [Enterobacter cloacae complex]|uniref:BRO-N domain-containing protein n=1 Tax=Enterobacter cloacae complex TaxID=354276 RepID=UPI002006ACDE|nr:MULTISPECIES: BRO family protein [Enterobacter cloacae complex]EKS9201634.1 antirepressor protein [Enterobacter cloacae]EKV5785135.1 antirepressor protein [Enterobacter cloacae]MCK7317749.1 antirepressor protein [Enterobacter cloacae]MDO6168355.1 BRO family protein [Enterobacter hormaechei]MDO6171553.1 BRO family protein [Enterobacter hormaechei]